MDCVYGLINSGAGCIGLGRIPNVLDAQDVYEFGLYIIARPLLLVIGIINVIYNAVMDCFYTLFPCFLGVASGEAANPTSELLRGCSPGPNFQRIAFQMDWTPTNPAFDTTYLRRLVTGNNADWQMADAGHSHTVKEFFTCLYNNTPTRQLSADNQARLKLIVLATLKHIDSVRDLDDRFSELFRETMDRMNDALHHCMNNINPTLYTIMVDVMAAASGGSMAYRVQLALQSFRANCLAAAVRNVLSRITNARDRDYHMGHEAASETWYLKRMYGELSLPEPSSVFDNNYENMAFKGADGAVRAEFNRLYTPDSVVDYLHANIGVNRNLPKAMFTDWLRRNDKFVKGGDGAPILEDEMYPLVTDPSGNRVRIYEPIDPTLASDPFLAARAAEGARLHKFLIRDYLLSADAGVLVR